MHRFWLGLIALLLPLSTMAQETVPPSLQEWHGWVLKDQAFRTCALLAGRQGRAQDDYLCAWPGTLTIAADAAGARIAQRWQLEAEGWVPLPGDAEHWPQRVTVGGIATPVVDHGDPRCGSAAAATRCAPRFRGRSGRSRCACRARSP